MLYYCKQKKEKHGEICDKKDAHGRIQFQLIRGEHGKDSRILAGVHNEVRLQERHGKHR